MLAIPLIGTVIAVLTIAGLWMQYCLQQRQSSHKEAMLAPFKTLARQRYPNARSPEEAIGLLARDALGLPELILLPKRTLQHYDPATGMHQATYFFRSRHNTVLTDIHIHIRFGSPIASAAGATRLTTAAITNVSRNPVALDGDKHGLSCTAANLPAGGTIQIHVQSRHPLPNGPEVHLQPHPSAPAQ